MSALQYGDVVSLWLEDESGHVWADGHVDGRCTVRSLHASFRGALFELESTRLERGNVVRGGERLHLRHVRSQRLLSTRPHSSSATELNHLRVELSSEEPQARGRALHCRLDKDTGTRGSGTTTTAKRNPGATYEEVGLLEMDWPELDFAHGKAWAGAVAKLL